MRLGLRVLLTGALIVPFGFIGAQQVGAATGTTCSKVTGTATFNPPLPKHGSTTEVASVITSHGKASGCSGGGVTGGSFKSKVKIHDPTNCDALLGGDNGTPVPSGTLTTTWNTAATSVAAVTLNPVAGQVTQTHITGTVTSGLFSGGHIDVTLSFTPVTGNCLTTDLSKVSVKNVTPLTIS
jgi:hypothetical protein